MAVVLAALLCFVLAAVGYDTLRGSGSAAVPWLLGAVVVCGASTVLLSARWTIRQMMRRERRP